MDSTDDRFLRLLSVVLDGHALDEDRVELEQLIVAHPRLADRAVQEAFIHSLLQWQGEDVAQYVLDDAFDEAGDADASGRGWTLYGIAASPLN